MLPRLALARISFWMPSIIPLKDYIFILFLKGVMVMMARISIWFFAMRARFIHPFVMLYKILIVNS